MVCLARFVSNCSFNQSIKSQAFIRRAFSTQSANQSVRLPAGYRAAGVRCGIKKKAGKLDFALIQSTTPAAAAAVFTTNKFMAAPCIASKQLLQSSASAIGGVMINAGCANACTGERGLADAKTMIQMGSQYGIDNPLVMSTGVIGPFLDMQKIEAGLKGCYETLTDNISGWELASQAIMTTDTVPKLLVKSYQTASGRTYSMAGMCKGAGMIHPNMATMLGVIATDASVSAECLQIAVKYAADRSFNSISVDGDTSTNDTVAVLANGQAPGLTKADHIDDPNSPEFKQFQDYLTAYSIELAQKLVRDGEGATKFVTVEVRGGASYEQAKQAAQSIATSALVKTAMYGQDANWGRIVCAVGYSGIDVNPDNVSLWFVDQTNDSDSSNLQLLRAGQPYQTNEERATELVRRPEIHIRIDLGNGKEDATVWTCDFSIDYVKINADYRS